jgi:hypothetical protein
MEVGGGPGSALSLSLGRQEMHLGEGKLLGSYEWGEGSGALDGARLSFRGGEGRWLGELFRMEAGRRGGRDLDGELLGFYNRFHFGDYPGRRRGLDPYLPSRGEAGSTAWGAPFAARIRDGARVEDWNDWARADSALFGRRELERGRFHALDAYLLLREDDGPGEGAGGPGETYTLGVRSDGRAGRWGYAFEGAYQFGGRGGRDVRAHAVHARLSRALSGSWKPVVLLEMNRATGDADPNDGTWERFDNLFPDNHIHYGHADLVSWTNLNHLRLGLSVRPTRRSGLSLDLHHFAVESSADGWFDADGECLGEAEGGASREIGWEIDVTYLYEWAPGFSILAGYAYFEPSGFAEAVGEDGSRQRLFLQTRFRY